MPPLAGEHLTEAVSLGPDFADRRTADAAQVKTILVLGHGANDPALPAAQLEPHVAPASRHRLEPAGGAGAADRRSAYSDRRAFQKESAFDIGAALSGNDGGDDGPRSPFLHGNGGEPDIKRARREETLTQGLIELRVHVVDVRL